MFAIAWFDNLTTSGIEASRLVTPHPFPGRLDRLARTIFYQEDYIAVVIVIIVSVLLAKTANMLTDIIPIEPGYPTLLWIHAQ